MRDNPEAEPGTLPAVEGGGICVLVNPASGEGTNADRLGDVRAAFSALGADAEVHEIHGNPADAAADAVRKGFGTVVAMGGDGTVNAVAGALAGTSAQLGVIPGGTFNYFARSLNIPADLASAVRIIVEGDVRPIHVGRAGGLVFLNNASIGAYASILAHREDVYKKWGRGRIAAYWSALRALLTWRKPLQISIESEEKTCTFRTPILFAMNNSFQIHEMGLEGEDLVQQGKLAVFVSPDVGRWGMVKQAIKLALGIAERNRDFELFGTRRMSLEVSRRRTLIAIDGERSRVRTPIVFEIEEQPVPVLVPRSARDKPR